MRPLDGMLSTEQWRLDHRPQVGIVPQCSPLLHRCPALCLVVSGDGSPTALQYRRCCGQTLKEGKMRWKQQAP
jgi:hypothetical protein